jgi:outer membrane protein assembly factor BamB
MPASSLKIVEGHLENEKGPVMKKLEAALLAAALAALAAIAWSASEVAAQENLKNWPQWRGPLANGVAPQADPPVAWGEDKNIVWKVKCLGGGSASPIVWGDKVFVLAAVAADKPAGAKDAAAPTAAEAPAKALAKPQGARPGGGMPRGAKPTTPYKFEVLCFDRATGRLVWQRTAHEETPHEAHHPSDGGYACYSPITDGQNVYAYFGSRGLYCYDLAGNRKWERDLGKMNIVMQFGEGGSPALHGDKLIINRDHEGESALLVLDKNTGQTLWQAKRDEKTSWATPLVIEREGKAEVITSATNRTRAYDLESGKVLWECGGLTKNVIPSPVSGFGMVFAASGFRGSALQAIVLGRSGDLTGTDAVKWSANRGTPYVPSPLLYGDKLYLFSVNNAILSCYQAETGVADFTEKRLEGLSGVYASPVGAADRVYVVGRNGTAVVLKRSKDLEILATNTLDDAFDASPAVVAKQLFLRGKQYLYCLGAKE